MLAGEPNAYDRLRFEISKLEDLHSNLIHFTQKRLSKKYGIELANDSIPAHLLGKILRYSYYKSVIA